MAATLRGRGILSLEVEQARFARSMRAFLDTRAPEVVDLAVRKMAFDVVRETTLAMNGIEVLPKRIDTGRLRAGWRVAMADGGLPTEGLPSSAASQPGDGTAVVGRAGGLARIVTVQNRVAYAGYVEHGTRWMRPGKHLERALRVVRAALPGGATVRAPLLRAWRSA